MIRRALSGILSIILCLPFSVLSNSGDDGILEANPKQIIQARKRLKKLQQALYGSDESYEAVGGMVTHDPGEALKNIQVYLSPHQPTVVQFVDAFGSPWAISQTGNVDSGIFKVEEVTEAHGKSSLILYTDKTAGFAIFPVFLAERSMPIILRLDIHKNKHHQYRAVKVMDVYHGSERSKGLMVKASSEAMHAQKHDPDLNHILHGVRPENANELEVHSADANTRAWRKGATLFIRTPLKIFNPEYDAVEYGQNDFVAYKFPVRSSRYLAFDEYGNQVDVYIPGVSGD